jgi:predicted MPP superfamily phosphohydrolase
MFRIKKENFTEMEKSLITELYYQKTPIQDICKTLDLEYYEVLYYITKIERDFQKIRNMAACQSFDDKKLIAIADTHIGSSLENMEYIHTTYNYARKNKVRSILHLGDLIQSTYKPVSGKYTNQEVQIQHLLDEYPQLGGIETYIVLGNHDYNTFSKNPELLELVQSRGDLHILGFYKAYIDWQGRIISLSHRTAKYNINIPNIPRLLDLKGHSHKLTIQRNEIHIPTLSDDLKENARPGFILLEHTPENIDIYSKELIDDQIKSRGKVLTKKI